MQIVTLDPEGELILRESLRRRCGLDSGEDFLLEKMESGLALHPLRPGVCKAYLEPTIRCNLHFPVARGL